MPNIDDLKSELQKLLVAQSVRCGTFTLASGRQSDFYVDSKKTVLDPEGAYLLGQIGWDIIKNRVRATGIAIDVIGGLTMGADPIAYAISMAAWLDETPRKIQVVNVRKSPKAHGLHKLIEGNFKTGDIVVVVDDVITTGGSTIQAIKAVQEAGGKVAFVLVLVDRQEGGRENIESLGHEVLAIFTREDLTRADVRSNPPAHFAVA